MFKQSFCYFQSVTKCETVIATYYLPHIMVFTFVLNITKSYNSQFLGCCVDLFQLLSLCPSSSTLIELFMEVVEYLKLLVLDWKPTHLLIKIL